MMHSHVYESSGKNLDATIKSMIPRLKYLTRRIVESLSEANKIWVYKQFNPLSEDEILSLQSALFKYNTKNKLLCIRRPTNIKPEGHVDGFRDGVAIGYVEFKQVQDLNSPAHFDAYLKVCIDAYNFLQSNEE